MSKQRSETTHQLVEGEHYSEARAVPNNTAFQAARELIRDRKYEEAKTILSRINHPKAEALIAKLDERLHQRETVNRIKAQALRESRRKKSLRPMNIFWTLLYGVIGFVFLALSIGFFIAFLSPSPDYIVENSDHYVINRVVQVVFGTVLFIGGLQAFQRGWKRISWR